MKGFGQRLRERARELGLADATVAERLGLSQQRYYNYISDQTEPDFETLVRMCRALAIEPNMVLGFTVPQSDEDEATILRARIAATASTMSPPALRLTAAVVDTLAREQVNRAKPPARTGRASRAGRPREHTKESTGQ